MEHPAFAGVIWYQGESNAHNFEAHERLFPMLVDSWRSWFGNPELPFYYVQLSSLERPSWPWFRDSQRRLLESRPNLGMAVTSDLGDPSDVHYKDKSIYDVLNMTVEEALPFFENIPSIHRKIETLNDVGLSYIRLGQPSTTLSGGEAQRVKLATELSRKSTGRTIYLLDEPTTGLHFADVHKLVEILHRLAEGGNTVVVIEHNLDVIKTADYIIDMGPEGGDKGGTVIACGTPEEVAANEASYTGQYVRKYLE